MAGKGRSRRRGGLVYSSEHGSVCPTCEQPVASCRCKERSAAPAADGPVSVSRERKGRRGKTVTVVSGLPLAGAELKKQARELKQACGTGGTVKDGQVEIQGDHCEQLIDLLTRRGWAVKRTGG